MSLKMCARFFFWQENRHRSRHTIVCKTKIWTHTKTILNVFISLFIWTVKYLLWDRSKIMAFSLVLPLYLRLNIACVEHIVIYQWQLMSNSYITHIQWNNDTHTFIVERHLAPSIFQQRTKIFKHNSLKQ